MRHIFLKTLIFCFLLLSTLSVQGQTFNWTDTAFELGSTRNIHLYYDFDGPCSRQPCAKFQGNDLVYDTLFTFLNKNPNLKIEIEYYSSNNGSDRYSINFAERRAKGIRLELMKLGFLKRQFNCIYTYDTISFSKQRKAFRKINVKIIGNELPVFAKELSKDTIAQKYYQKHDYFKVPVGDTLAWNNIGQYFKKVLEQDTTLFLEIEWQQKAIDLDRNCSEKIKYNKKVEGYFIQKYDIKKKQIKQACVLTYKDGILRKDWRQLDYILFKIVKRQEYIECQGEETRRQLYYKSLCEGCPF